VITGFYQAISTDRLGAVFLLGLALTVLGVVLFRERRLILLLVWFVALWAPITLLGGITDPMQPTLRVQLVRYWTAILAPVIIGGIATIVMILKRMPAERLDPRPVVALLAVGALGYVALTVGVLANTKRDQDWRELRTWFAAHPEVSAIYTDDRTAQVADFYTMSPGGDRLWPGTFVIFHNRQATVPASIGHTPYLQSLLGAKEQPSAATGWHLLWRSSNGVLAIWQR